MSVWEIGDVYDYYGTPIRPVSRWFDDTLELIAFVYVPPVMTPEGWTFVRAARALAPCVKPKVTEFLGGVERSDMCPHYPEYGQAMSRFGPNECNLCCMGCGGIYEPSERVGEKAVGKQEQEGTSGTRSQDG